MLRTRRLRTAAVAALAALALTMSGCALFDSSVGAETEEAAESFDPALIEVTESVGGISQGKVIRAKVLPGATPDAVADDVWGPVVDYDIDSLMLTLPSGVSVELSSDAPGEEQVRAMLSLAFDDALARFETPRLKITAQLTTVDVRGAAAVDALFTSVSDLVQQHGVTDSRGTLSSSLEPSISLAAPLGNSTSAQELASFAAGMLEVSGFSDTKGASVLLDDDGQSASITITLHGEQSTTVADAAILHAHANEIVDTGLVVNVAGSSDHLVELL